MPDDASIPVLTERLTLPSLDLDISLPQPPPPVVAPASLRRRPRSPRCCMPKPGPLRRILRHARRRTRARATALDAVRLRGLVAPPFSSSPADAGSTPPIDWDNIEAQLRDSLLRELQPQLSAELEKQVRERLQPTLVRALTALISDLRPALDSTVRETISRAIAAEVERQRSLS